MREETRKRFEREIHKQWLARGAMALAAIVAIGAALWFQDLDAHVDNRHVAGVVAHVGPVSGLNTQAIQNGLAVDVRLEDGREVHVTALKAARPEVGARVEITEHVHGSGRSTFSWK